MRRDKALLQDIQSTIESIENFLAGKSREEFLASDLLQSAVMRKLEIIGEASKKVSREIKNHYADVPWKAIAGMRDKLIHDYFGVLNERVWETAVTFIPQLKSQTNKILNELDKNLFRD